MYIFISIHTLILCMYTHRYCRPDPGSQKEAVPLVQSPSSGGETVWRLLQPRDHARGSSDHESKVGGERRTAQLPSGPRHPLQPRCDRGTAVQVHRCLERRSRVERTAVRGGGNRQEHGRPKTGAGLVQGECTDAVQAPGAFLLWRPQWTFKVRVDSILF